MSDDESQFNGPQCLLDLYVILAKKNGLITGNEKYSELMSKLVDPDDDPECIDDFAQLLLKQHKLITGNESYEEVEAMIEGKEYVEMKAPVIEVCKCKCGNVECVSEFDPNTICDLCNGKTKLCDCGNNDQGWDYEFCQQCKGLRAPVII